MEKNRPGTTAVHGRRAPRPGPLTEPLVQTSTFTLAPAAEMRRYREMMKALGGCLDPHAAFLVRRGLKTLHLRVERQSTNALELARALEGQAGIDPGMVRLSVGIEDAADLISDVEKALEAG